MRYAMHFITQRQSTHSTAPQRLLSPPRPINTPNLDALKRVLPASLPLLDPLDDRVIPVGSFLFLRKYLVDVRGEVLFVLSS